MENHFLLKLGAIVCVSTIGGGILFVAFSILEFLIGGGLGWVFFEKLLGSGFGVPFRFFGIGWFGLSAGFFSVSKLILDWIIWCLVFAALWYSVRILIQHTSLFIVSIRPIT